MTTETNHRIVLSTTAIFYSDNIPVSTHLLSLTVGHWLALGHWRLTDPRFRDGFPRNTPIDVLLFTFLLAAREQAIRVLYLKIVRLLNLK